jgi:hypothetical protein
MPNDPYAPIDLMADTGGSTSSDPYGGTAALEPLSPAGEREEDVNYLEEVGVGAVNGGLGFVQSLLDLGIDVANIPIWLYNNVGDNDAAYIGHGEKWSVGETQTWVGGLTSGVVQFGLGMVTGSKLLTGIGYAAKAGKVQAGRAMLQGAIADFISFDEHEERLSNLIQEFPALKNPVSEYLAADDDDSWLEGRFKNTVEGVGLGYLTDVFLPSLRAFKAGKKELAKGGSKEAAAKAAAKEINPEEMAKAVSRLEKMVNPNVLSDEVAGEALSGGSKEIGSGLVVMPDEGEVAEAVSRKFDVKDFTENLKKRIDKGEPLTNAHRTTAANYDKMLDPRDAPHVLEQLKKTFQEGGLRDPETDIRSLSDMADHAAMFGLRGEEVVSAVRSLSEHSEQLAPLMKAGEVLMEFGARRASEAAYKAHYAQFTGDSLKEARQAILDSLEYSRTYFKAQADIGRASTVHRVSNKEVIDRMASQAGKGPSNGITKLSAAEKKVQDLITQYKAMPDSELQEVIPKIVAVGGRMDRVNKLLTSTKSGAIVKAHNEVLINSMLFSVPSMVIDGLSGIVKMVMSPLDRAIGGVLTGSREVVEDSGRLWKGQAKAAVLEPYLHLRRVLFDHLEIAEMANKAPELGSAPSEAWKALLGGENRLDIHGLSVDNAGNKAISAQALGLQKVELDDAGKAVTSPTVLGKFANFIGNVVRMPTRLRMSVDELNKQIAYRGAVEALATREALDQGLEIGSEKFTKYIADRFAKAFDPATGRAMNDKALDYAREISFTEDLDYGWGKSLQRFTTEHPVFKSVMPFVRTPTNILRDAWARTPALQFFNKKFRADLLSGDPMRVAKARGQQATGCALWAAGIMLANEERITGAGPADPELKSLWMATGKRPYSVKIGDHWFQYSRLDPYGMFLGLSADFASVAGSENTNEENDVVSAMTVSLAGNLANKTYLMGLTEMLNAFSKPEQEAERWWQRRLQSYIPGAVPQIGKAITGDSALKDVRNWMDAILARTPGFSEKVAPRRNILGEKIDLPTAYGSGWISPFAASRQLDDPVKQELSDLGHGFTMPHSKRGGVELRDYRNSKGQNAYDRWMELNGTVKVGGKTLGEALNSLITSDYYKSLPKFSEEDIEFTNPRVRAVQRVLGRYRSVSLRETLREYPELAEAQAEFRRRQHVANTQGLEGLTALSE